MDSSEGCLLTHKGKFAKDDAFAFCWPMEKIAKASGEGFSTDHDLAISENFLFWDFPGFKISGFPDSQIYFWRPQSAPLPDEL